MLMLINFTVLTFISMAAMFLKLIHNNVIEFATRQAKLHRFKLLPGSAE